MILNVISSSSDGNCYLLTDSGGNTLIIECGVRMAEIKQALRFRLSGVVGCVVTHEHNDHARSISPLLKSGIMVLASEETLKAKGVYTVPFALVAKPKHRYQLGGFSVLALQAYHDAPCLCYVIEHEEMGKLLFATDTYKLPYRIKGISHMMIECNYLDEVVEWREKKGLCPEGHKDRLMLSHMELKTTAKVIEQNLCDSLQDIILLHLSSDNADAERMTDYCGRVSGLPVYAAHPGMEMIIGNTPY